MSAATELQRAFQPLIDRAQRRAARIKQLQAQPQTEQTVKAIAAEQREIALFTQAATATERVIARLTEQTQARQDKAEAALGRVQQVADDASHYESLLFKALELAPALPPEQWPRVVLRAHNAIYRMHYLKTSPETYAATFASPTNP